MKKSLVFAYLIFASPFIVISQTSLEKNKELSVMVGMASTRIKNSNLSQNEHLTIDNKNGVDFSFEFAKYFKNRIGIGFGLGCSTYGQSYDQKGLYKQSNQVDKDGYTYERWTSSDMEYSNKLTYLNVPVTLHLILGNSPTYYGFIDAGIINQFLINGTYTEEGNIETMAKYSTNNPYWSDFTLNNTYYDLKNKPVSKKDMERYKFYNLSTHFSVGFAAAITENFFLKVAPSVNIGLSDIMGKDGKEKNYENVLGESFSYKKTTLFSAGINVGFAFNL